MQADWFSRTTIVRQRPRCDRCSQPRGSRRPWQKAAHPARHPSLAGCSKRIALAYPPKGISLSKPERNRPPKSKILNATDHSAKRSLFKGRHHLDGLAHVVSFLYLVNAIARFRFRFTGFGGECPALLTIYGCGTVSAAALAVAGGGNPERLKSEAEFASLCGVAPLLASSGKTERHRLNRGGDRRANRALYQIAVTRMSYDQRTKDYVGKRKRDGKSKKEAIRCLKRYIAREVFRACATRSKSKGRRGRICAPQDKLWALLW